MAAPARPGGNVHPAEDEAARLAGQEQQEEEPPSVGTGSSVPEQDKKEAADKRPATDSSFLNGKTAVAVFLGLVYWITVYTLPIPPNVGNHGWSSGSLFVGIAVFGLLFSVMGRGRGNIDRLQAACLVAYVLTLDWLLASAYYRLVDYTPDVKFAVAVGGLAVASFIYGVIAFDTIRAAASLPIVVLFIGLAVSSKDVTVDPEIKNQLVLWMGIILGANAVGEAANQGAKVISAGKVSSAVAASTGSAEEAGEMQRRLTSEIKAIGGDLAPSVSEANRQGAP